MNEQLLQDLNSKMDKLLNSQVASVKMAEKMAQVSIKTFDLAFAGADEDMLKSPEIMAILEMRDMLVETVREFQQILGIEPVIAIQPLEEVIGYCPECSGRIYESDKCLPDYDDVYECSTCRYPLNIREMTPA